MEIKQPDSSHKLISGNWNLDLILEKFQFEEIEVSVYRVRNLDELVDQVSDDEFNVDERLPYWAELWPSALALSRFLSQHSELVRDKNVLELGCGLGLTSLVAGQLKPHNLVCTDYEEASLDLTRLNFKLNALETPVLKLMDWRTPDTGRQFEVILASDVLYEERFFEPLLHLFDCLLDPFGILILAEPNRSIARKFFVRLSEQKYTYKTHFLEIWQSGQRIVVSVYLIRKGGSAD